MYDNPALVKPAYVQAELGAILDGGLFDEFAVLWLLVQASRFQGDAEGRASLRAELDAYSAHLYCLARDELRYILDPADLLGPDYSSETFRVLKNNELRQFGKYRMQRLVLKAWARMLGGLKIPTISAVMAKKSARIFLFVICGDSPSGVPCLFSA